MVQGLRRCQATAARPLTVGSLTEHRREFYTGRPLWRVSDAVSVEHPEGYVRFVDADTGALGWAHAGGDIVLETDGFWERTDMRL